MEETIDILLVENDADAAAKFREILDATERRQWTLRSVPSLSALGPECFRARPHLVVLNLELVDTQGLATVRAFRSLSLQLPVLALTSTESLGLDASAIELGAQDCIGKSELNPRTLERAVRYAMERWALSGRLTASDERLAQLYAERDEFALVAAHDLKAPLRRIVSFLELVNAEAGPLLSEQARYYMGFVNEASLALTALVDSLLRFARAGYEVGQGQRVELGACLASAVRLVEQEDAGVQVECKPLPQHFWGDSNLMVSVFYNLLCNALSRRGAGGVRISVSAEQRGGEILVFVSDDGAGIDPSRWEDLFDPVRQLRFTETTVNAGLGLAVSRRVVQGHRGRLEVACSSEQSTTFRLTLPVAPVP